jgi:hypothetical protein
MAKNNNIDKHKNDKTTDTTKMIEIKIQMTLQQKNQNDKICENERQN